MGAKAIPLALLGWLLSSGAQAHDTLADGSPVPSWVKTYCCSESTVHVLDASDVKELPNGYWRVKNFTNLVPPDRVFPSQDSLIYAFYDANTVPESTYVRCLLVAESN
jgi:hypothetical protein